MSEPKLPEEYAPRTMTAVQWGQCCAIVTKATHKTQWQSALLMVFAELASVRAALAQVERDRDEWKERASLSLDARDEADARLAAIAPGIEELNEKLADHKDWLRRQRMMRVAFAPVNVEGVGDMIVFCETLAREGLAAEVALAASQARIAELREALASAKADIVCWLRAYGSETHSQAVAEVERAEYALARPDDASALREMLTKACAEAGRHAAKIAELYESKWGVDKPDEHGFADTASAAILTDLCDPDDPDTLRIVSRVLGGEWC